MKVTICCYSNAVTVCHHPTKLHEDPIVCKLEECHQYFPGILYKPDKSVNSKEKRIKQ